LKPAVARGRVSDRVACGGWHAGCAADPRVRGLGLETGGAMEAAKALALGLLAVGLVGLSGYGVYAALGSIPTVSELLADAPSGRPLLGARPGSGAPPTATPTPTARRPTWTPVPTSTPAPTDTPEPPTPTTP